VDSRRIDQNDLRVFAIEDALNAIAGGLRFRRDNGDFLADESIDERGLPRVGAAYDCDETRLECHESINCTPLGCGAEVRRTRGRGSQKICRTGIEKGSASSTDTRALTRRGSGAPGASPDVDSGPVARDLCASGGAPRTAGAILPPRSQERDHEAQI